MQIQWYPGHMAKAKRLLSAQLSNVDIVVELCDARLPLSSRNPDLEALILHKRRVLLLCKADLAQPEITQKWLSHFRRQGLDVMAYDKSPRKTKEARELISTAARDVLERNQRRGIRKVLLAMVVGVPNVGKSTFINRLYGSAVTRTADRPGVTRSNQWVKVSRDLEIMDTPGLLWPKLNDPLAATRLAYIGTIRDAVYDQYELCYRLLEDLLRLAPQSTMERFRIANADARGYELVCEYDLDRACSVVLDEFREGKVGKLTLETPQEGDANAQAF